MSRPVMPTPPHDQVIAAVARLVGDLFGPDWLGDTCEVVPAESLAPAVRKLLVHNDHMTRVLEEHFGQPLKLRLLADREDPGLYRRAIVLVCEASEVVAEFGAVRIELNAFGSETREEILERRSPLGDILIRHNVLRRVEPRAFLRFHGKSPILQYFARPNLTEAFGRWGTLHANGAPAIDLLEIVTTE